MVTVFPAHLHRLLTMARFKSSFKKYKNNNNNNTVLRQATLTVLLTENGIKPREDGDVLGGSFKCCDTMRMHTGNFNRKGYPV